MGVWGRRVMGSLKEELVSAGCGLWPYQELSGAGEGTYTFSFLKQKLVSSQGEVAGLPPFDELPSHLLLFEFSLHEGLALLVDNCGKQMHDQALHMLFWMCRWSKSESHCKAVSLEIG